MTQDHALRRWRKENGITLAALADRVGVTPSHLSEVETGNNVASMRLAAKLSRLTNGVVPVDAFMPQSEAAQ